MGKLTAVAVKAAMAKPSTYQDGDGLFLKVDKRGGAVHLACEFEAIVSPQTNGDWIY